MAILPKTELALLSFGAGNHLQDRRVGGGSGIRASNLHDRILLDPRCESKPGDDTREKCWCTEPRQRALNSTATNRGFPNVPALSGRFRPDPPTPPASKVKSMRLTPFFLSLVLSFTLIPVNGVKAADKELEKMQGNWTAEVETDEGKKKASLSVEGKKIRFDGPDGQEWYEGTFEIDASAKPKRMSVLIEDCPFEQFKKQTVEAIYTLENDTWTICATAPGAPEGPSGFDDEKTRTLELKKDK